MIAKRPQTPPADLASRSPDWFSWPTSAVLWQLAATTGRWSAPFATLRHFGPLPSARFDPHSPPPHTSPTEGVLYAGTDLLTALAERFQHLREIRRDQPGDPVAYSWAPTRPLQLLDLTDSAAVRLGASHVINTGRKDVTRVWARALRAAWPEADGVLYSSPMTGRNCTALWTPAQNSFPPAPAFATLMTYPAPEWQNTLRGAAAELGYTYA